MDTNLIPTQQTALEHASPAARQSHQDALASNRDQVEKGRVVPPFTPVVTLEQRVSALEADRDALRNWVAQLEAKITALSTPALPPPAAELSGDAQK